MVDIALLNGQKTLRPKSFGSLGILDFDLFSRALRLRWLWFEWTEPEQPWVAQWFPLSMERRQASGSCRG
jgi:hypothetical protein